MNLFSDVRTMWRMRGLLAVLTRREISGRFAGSAGGMLTGMATAWFQKHALPRPGAVGIFCAAGANNQKPVVLEVDRQQFLNRRLILNNQNGGGHVREPQGRPAPHGGQRTQ